MTESVLAILQRHPFAAAFEPGEVATLAKLATRVHFDRNQVVFREGDECPDFFLLVSGMVALEIAAPDHTFRVQTVHEGHEFGWSALLMGSGKYFQARALEDVEALSFHGPDILATCKHEPHFGFIFMQRLLGVVAERLQVTRLQLVDMHSPDAKRAGA